MFLAPTTLSVSRVIVLLLVVLRLFLTEGWTVPSTTNRIRRTTIGISSKPDNNNDNTVSRRTVLVSSISAALLTCIGTKNVAHAACLYGDLSPNCIGVYKVPMENDTAIRNLQGRPDAPSLNSYSIPPISIPRSVQEAQRTLETQRQIADDISANVLAGRLQQAGIQVLNLLPPLIVSGRVLLDHAVTVIMANRNNNNAVVAELQKARLEELWQTNVVAWNTVDITIGQGLRGTLGVSVVAQLAILDALREATVALDEFLLAVTTTKKTTTRTATT